MVWRLDTMSKIILACDGINFGDYYDLAMLLGDRIAGVKLHHLFDEHHTNATSGAYLPRRTKVWLDMKVHDTPDTVALRVSTLAKCNARLITVHASGGPAMLQAAVGAVEDTLAEVIAVTALTSLTDDNVRHIYGADRASVVARLASMAVACGVTNLVCSPNEVALLRREFGNKVTLFVPGTRSLGKDVHDQKNVTTPAQAIADGADYLVIGRQVTKAKDMFAALAEIEAEIAGA